MNPGLLRDPLQIERKGIAQDDLGQPIDDWSWVGAVYIRGWRRRAAPVAEGEHADRKREAERSVFRVRSRPFTTHYQAGDRFKEPARGKLPEKIWEIAAVSEVEGTHGEYLDVTVERFS